VATHALSRIASDVYARDPKVNGAIAGDTPARPQRGCATVLRVGCELEQIMLWIVYGRSDDGNAGDFARCFRRRHVRGRLLERQHARCDERDDFEEQRHRICENAPRLRV
jgi:hypothetical protein